MNIKQALETAALRIANTYYTGNYYIDDKTAIANGLHKKICSNSIGAIVDSCTGDTWVIWTDEDTVNSLKVN